MSVSITAVQCTTFQNNWADIKWANVIFGQTRSQDLSLRYVSDRYPMLHKAPDCDSDPHTHTHTITCSKHVLLWFHENSLSHKFAKRRTETTYKNPVIIFKSLRIAEWFSVLHDTELWYQISEMQEIFFDEHLNIVIAFKYLWKSADLFHFSYSVPLSKCRIHWISCRGPH